MLVTFVNLMAVACLTLGLLLVEQRRYSRGLLVFPETTLFLGPGVFFVGLYAYLGPGFLLEMFEPSLAVYGDPVRRVTGALQVVFWISLILYSGLVFWPGKPSSARRDEQLATEEVADLGGVGSDGKRETSQ